MREADRIGMRVASFRLERHLGSGGSAEVYLAERVEAFRQRVAIKLFEPDDPAALREPVQLAALDHPGIVRLIDRGELPGGGRYVVMDYIDGVPVDVFCADSGRSDPECIAVLVKIAQALSHAHQHLVIHADLKPSNILVSADGEPRVVDFGGGHTPLFASPEQLDRQPLAAASDVYSLGTLARVLLAGRRISTDLQAVLETATRRDPADRYASMDLFAADLQCVLDGRPVRVRPISTAGQLLRWSLRHRLAATTAALVTITMLFATGAVVVDSLRAERQRLLVQAQLRRLVTLTGALQGELYQSAAQLPRSLDARKVLLGGARRSLQQLTDQAVHDPALQADLARQSVTLSHLDRDAAGASTPAQ